MKFHFSSKPEHGRMGGSMKGLSRVHLACCVLLGLVGMAFAVAARQGGMAQPQPGGRNQPLIASVKGSDLFHAYCASCHGDDGKGNGPVAGALNTRPSDLTTIAKRHGGVFPAKRIRDIIAGEDVVMAHGSSEMPVWGPIFHRVEWDQDLGNVRLQNLVKYLESIQRK
jgi:mono/diheme cytochrome c family protein